MNHSELRRLYNSSKNKCCKCGCNLEDVNGKLGSVFVLDTDGNFYCMNCDSEFEEGDERIYDINLYPKVRVDLTCSENYHHIFYVYGDREEIKEVLQDTRRLVDIWLNDEEGFIPDEYDWCACDEDFYMQSLYNNFEVEDDADDYLLYQF